MGIKQTKDGRWLVSYCERHPLTRMPTTRRRIVESEAAAKKVYAKLVIEVNRLLEASISPTWNCVLEKFYLHLRDRQLTEKTIFSYQKCLEKYTLPHWSEKLSSEITTSEIRTLVTESFSTCSESHKSYLVGCIRAVFAYCLEEGFIERNPTPQFKFKPKDKVFEVLTESQCRLLLETAKNINHEWYYIWAFAIYTGMRSGELYALSWANVDLERKFIRVRESWNNKDGFKSTKSGHDRLIEIPEYLMPVIRSLETMKGQWGDFVLPRMRQWDKGDQARELQAFLSVLGLPKMRFHDLRATWATLMLSNGVEHVKVMAMGGWADPKTMMIYCRKNGIDIRGSTECLKLHDHNKVVGNVIPMRM